MLGTIVHVDWTELFEFVRNNLLTVAILSGILTVETIILMLKIFEEK